MTYADVITLLLCFFAVSLAASMPKQPIAPKAEVQMLTPPPVPQPQTIQGNLPFQIPAEPDDVLENVANSAPPPITDPDTRAILNYTPIPPVATVSEAPPVPLQAIVDKLNTEGGANLQKGDRITTLRMASTAFFTSGSATLSAYGKSILQSVATDLKVGPYQDYQITVEGHTDDMPISTLQFPSNWELSSARASAVVHFFIEQGIAPQKLRAAGYADTFPIVPNRDADGKSISANEAQNRRVVIKLEKIDKGE